ncbi:c-type cytochrome [Edaphocola aurantiacus]|uniref:c-type cytochrome n=1 Tax=Edaphocola aurantiacus TaxID=2601682 RepID=UPI001FE6C45F|nr:c-type cytochrome [Edaphocola aurantiacus]
MALIAVLTVFGSFTQANAQDGKALFQANCASCHNPIKDATGPALQGITGRAPSTEWIHKWVKNSAAVIASGDKYANGIYTKWNKTAMTAFPNLKEEEVDAIIKYVEEYKAPTAAPAGGDTAGSSAKEADNTWLYVLVTIVLAVLALILIRINKGLHKVANTEQGIPNKKDVPLKRNKVFIAVVGILLFILAGYWMVNGGVEMGRQQNYMPKQPIFYSHKVHAGINQINCQYCHAGVNDSRQAMIPSTNVCMNCHKQIGEYTGEQLFDHEGNKIDGTAQIQELYKYAGWDPAKKEYKRDNQGKILATPIKWTKIHNLADFVYFNHSQHVRVGKVQCQTCHGPIQEMDEVKQFESLSMGWCINCHRETKVDFQNNNYYSIFEKYHQEIKDGKRDGVTEAELGGLECQKCHY